MLESKLLTAKGRKLICQMSGYIIRKNGRVYTVQYIYMYCWHSVFIFLKVEKSCDCLDFFSFLYRTKATDWKAKIVLCGIKKNAGKTPRCMANTALSQTPKTHSAHFTIFSYPKHEYLTSLCSLYWVGSVCRHSPYAQPNNPACFDIRILGQCNLQASGRQPDISDHSECPGPSVVIGSKNKKRPTYRDVGVDVVRGEELGA